MHQSSRSRWVTGSPEFDSSWVGRLACHRLPRSETTSSAHPIAPDEKITLSQFSPQGMSLVIPIIPLLHGF